MKQLSRTGTTSRLQLAINNRTKNIFETEVIEAIDDILSTLGTSNKHAVYSLLENHYGLSKNEIPHKIEAFAYAIEQTFGLAAQLIEIKVMKKLHTKFKNVYTPIKAEANFLRVHF